MPLDGALAAGTAADRKRLTLTQHRQQFAVGSEVLAEFTATGVDAARELSHVPGGS